MLIAFILILILSIILAVRSMKDFGVPKEVSNIISSKRGKGTILILKDKVLHYHGRRD